MKRSFDIFLILKYMYWLYFCGSHMPVWLILRGWVNSQNLVLCRFVWWGPSRSPWEAATVAGHCRWRCTQDAETGGQRTGKTTRSGGYFIYLLEIYWKQLIDVAIIIHNFWYWVTLFESAFLLSVGLSNIMFLHTTFCFGSQYFVIQLWLLPKLVNAFIADICDIRSIPVLT